jgi:hypothetical protein
VTVNKPWGGRAASDVASYLLPYLANKVCYAERWGYPFAVGWVMVMMMMMMMMMITMVMITMVMMIITMVMMIMMMMQGGGWGLYRCGANLCQDRESQGGAGVAGVAGHDGP